MHRNSMRQCRHCGRGYDDALWTADDMIWKPIVEGYFKKEIPVQAWMLFCPRCRSNIIKEVRHKTGL